MIAAGEPIVLDIGGTIDGYGSDITRTLWVTGGDPAKGPDERFRHLFAVLQGAQAAGDGGGPARDRRRGHRCARRARPIEAEGYGEAFFHRTGHGIGLEGHEEPYIIAGNDEPLAAGDGVLGRARDLPGRASTARGSRTSSCAGRTARSRSTRRRASCTSSTAEAGGRRVRALVGQPAVSSDDGSRPMRPATAFEYR